AKLFAKFLGVHRVSRSQHSYQRMQQPSRSCLLHQHFAATRFPCLSMIAVGSPVGASCTSNMLTCMVNIEHLNGVGKIETRPAPDPVPKIRRENTKPA